MKNNSKKQTLILLLITVIVLFFIIKDDYIEIVDNLSHAKLLYVGLGIAFTVSYWFFKTLALHNIVKEYRKKIKVRQIFKQITITQFFNGITPFASGGQPMQVYMLNKSGIKLAHSTNIIVQDFILYQMALITHGFIAVLLNFHFHFLADNPLLRYLTTIGFIINILVGLGLLFVSFSTKFNSFVVNKIIALFSKIRIVRNRDRAISNWKVKLQEFNESAQILRANKGLIIKGYIYNFFGLLSYYLTPLFVIYALGLDANITTLAVYVCCAYVSLIGSFVPIPGGSGGIEYSFLQFFGNFIKGSALSAVLIVWRSITYYFAIIIGSITFNTFKGVDEKCE